MILVESNVLIDIAQSDALWADWSAGQFAKVFDQGEQLAINAIVYAEISRIPDSFIAAHVQAEGAQLLTRDATRARTYFPDLLVIAPE